MKLKPEQVLYVQSMGKALRVTAIFDNPSDANHYMARNKDEAVVAELGTMVLIANVYDKGARWAKLANALQSAAASNRVQAKIARNSGHGEHAAELERHAGVWEDLLKAD